MKIAVASGKGGTGKTTVALALATAAGREAWLADCDVEEPNCHLFSAEEAAEEIPVESELPEFSADSCSGCGKCVNGCRFHALARLGSKVLVFPELCHACGNCIALCPEEVLLEKPYEIGRIQLIRDRRFNLAGGVMNVGYSMAPPVIRSVKKFVSGKDTVIVDCPPGTACSMVTAVSGCDFALLVTEPTAFGVHDLELARRVLNELEIPCGVILNRAGEGDEIISEYCRKHDLPLLMRIPFSASAASGYSKGMTLLDTMPELTDDFRKILEFAGGVK